MVSYMLRDRIEKRKDLSVPHFANCSKDSESSLWALIKVNKNLDTSVKSVLTFEVSSRFLFIVFNLLSNPSIIGIIFDVSFSSIRLSTCLETLFFISFCIDSLLNSSSTFLETSFLRLSAFFSSSSLVLLNSDRISAPDFQVKNIPNPKIVTRQPAAKEKYHL